MQSYHVLDTEEHISLKWSCLGQSCSYSCCERFQLLPVPLYEVIPLARYFPIVILVVENNSRLSGGFTAISRTIEQKACVFLSEGGCTLGDNRPSFCRAYPFRIVPSQDGKNLVLMDTNCPGFSHREGEAIFKEKGVINPYFDNEFLKFAFLIKEDATKTQEFIKELMDSNLLTGGKFIYKVGDQQKEIPFNYVDERRLLDMPRDKLKSFAEKGYLRIIYAHLNSLQNFQRLAYRVITAG